LLWSRRLSAFAQPQQHYYRPRPADAQLRYGYPTSMRIVRKLLVGLGRLATLVLATVAGCGSTPWLEKKLREEGEQTGRLL
jgi:hypothetical protein